jgi:hypothetical protein
MRLSNNGLPPGDICVSSFHKRSVYALVSSGVLISAPSCPMTVYPSFSGLSSAVGTVRCSTVFSDHQSSSIIFAVMLYIYAIPLGKSGLSTVGFNIPALASSLSSNFGDSFGFGISVTVALARNSGFKTGVGFPAGSSIPAFAKKFFASCSLDAAVCSSFQDSALSG